MGQADESYDITTEPRRDSPPPTHVRYAVLAVACSLGVLTYVQRLVFTAGGPYLKKDFDLDDGQMGYLMAVWLVAYAVFQVPGGLLGDRIGARRLLTFLVLGWSLLAGAVAPLALLPLGGWLPFALLLALRFLFGGFQAGGFPGLARVLTDWMPPRQRGFAQGMVWTFSRLGGALAPLLLFWLFEVFHGWATPFALIAGLGLLWCVGFWPWFRNQPEEMPQVNDAERDLIASGRGPAVAPSGPIDWSLFLKSRNAWALSLMYGFVGFSGNFVTSLLPIYLKDHRHLDDRTTAWLSGLPFAFGVISCVLGGVASDWLIRRLGSRTWGRRLVGVTVLSLGAVAILCTIWVHETWALGVVFSAMFFFNDANMAPSWASCADVGERYAGTLSGAMNMMGSLFGAAGAVFAGASFKRSLDTRVFIAFACSYALAALCWLAIDVTKPLVPRAEES